MLFTWSSLLVPVAVSQGFTDPTPAKGTELSEIPRIGMGTARITGNTSEVIAQAIVSGFRHIDCAWRYSNQRDVGVGIKEGIKRAGIDRKDLWVTSKLWNDRHQRADFAIKETLQELGLDYLDLWLMHWPRGEDTGKTIFDPVVTWKAMEKLVRPVNGTRFIGISNHSPQQVDDILKIATIRPKVHQFELHPYLPQSDWVRSNLAMNITVTGYAPLGNTNPIHNLGVSERNGKTAGRILQTAIIQQVAKTRGCSPAQVVLAWNLKRNVVVIPKASQESHQVENIHTLDKCNLTDEDIAMIDGLKVPMRLYPMACGYGLAEGCETR